MAGKRRRSGHPGKVFPNALVWDVLVLPMRICFTKYGMTKSNSCEGVQYLNVDKSILKEGYSLSVQNRQPKNMVLSCWTACSNTTFSQFRGLLYWQVNYDYNNKEINFPFSFSVAHSIRFDLIQEVSKLKGVLDCRT